MCGTGEAQPFIRNVFTLNSCSHIVGSQVLSFDDESKLLHAWRDFIDQVDPDVVIGYNVANFDWPYLIDRARHLKTTKFPYLGRLKGTLMLYFVLRRYIQMTPYLRRCQDTSERYPLLFEGLRSTRLKGDSPRWSLAA